MQNTPASLSGLHRDCKLPSGIKQVWATSDASGVGFAREAAVAEGEAAGGGPSSAPTPAPPAADDPVVMVAGSGAPSLLAASVHEAFYKHHPLKLNPNVLWVTIAQGLARIIEVDPEAFRSKFVHFDGKKALAVDDFSGSSPADMAWGKAFAGFAAQIGENIGADKLALLTAPFSNSTPNDLFASQITLMDAMQSFFTYSLRGGCGIPYIELQGTPADWAALRERAGALRALDVGPVTPKGSASFGPATMPPIVLSQWLDEVCHVLDKLAEAAGGAPDTAFFGAVCNAHGGSGSVGQPLTGWVTVFYPLTTRGLPASAWKNWRRIYDHTLAVGGADAALAAALAARGKAGAPLPPGCLLTEGLSLGSIPTGLARAPVGLTNIVTRQQWSLYFLAGPATMHQSRVDGALEVRCGWAVCELAGAVAGQGGAGSAAEGGGGAQSH